jgi:hypothetical protein
LQLTSIVTKNRNRLQSNTVKQLILLKSWGIFEYKENSEQRKLQREYLSGVSLDISDRDENTIENPIVIEDSTTNPQSIDIDEDIYNISDNISESSQETDYNQKDRNNSEDSEDNKHSNNSDNNSEYSEHNNEDIDNQDNRDNQDSYISDQIILTQK